MGNQEQLTGKKKPKVRKKRVKNFFNDFKNFMSKGNVLNLAVAVVMGTAFNAIITSLANDLLMPVIGLFFGKSDIAEWVVTIGGTNFAYGKFLFAIVNFIIIAFTLFIIIKIAGSTETNIKKIRKLAKKQRKLFQKGLVDTPEIQTPPPAPEPPKETAEDILKDIRRLLQEQEKKAMSDNEQ